MANMSYCRFENTLSDLKDCLYALEDGAFEDDEIDGRERVAMHSLILLCGEIYENYGEKAEEEEEYV